MSSIIGYDSLFRLHRLLSLNVPPFVGFSLTEISFPGSIMWKSKTLLTSGTDLSRASVEVKLVRRFLGLMSILKKNWSITSYFLGPLEDSWGISKVVID